MYNLRMGVREREKGKTLKYAKNWFWNPTMIFTQALLYQHSSSLPSILPSILEPCYNTPPPPPPPNAFLQFP